MADVERVLQGFQVCDPSINKPCNIFLALTPEHIYGINGFGLLDPPGSYQRANTFPKYVSSTPTRE